MDLNWYWYIGLGVLGGGVVGWVINAAVQKARKSSAEVLINKMREEASKEAEHIQREAKVTAKSEILKLREVCEHEL